MNKFKENLVVNNDKIDVNQHRFERLKIERELFETPEYRNFSDLMLITIGKEIEEHYPGVEFNLVSRFKSYDSFEKKAWQKLKQNSTLYDNIGYEIVIKKIPDDFETEDMEFNAKLDKLLLKRANAHDRLIENQTAYDEFIRQSETPEYISEMSNPIFEDTFKRGKRSAEEAVELSKKYLNNKNDDCELELAEHIITYLCERSDKIKELGIANIPNRRKDHNERSREYRASHDCIKVYNQNSPVMGWTAEIQAKSYYRYKVAEERSCCSY